MRRMLIVLLGSLALVVAAGCLDAAPPTEPMEQASATPVSDRDIIERFAGTWRLVSVERLGANGERLPPLEPPAVGSPNAIGFLMYDPAGYMGMVIQDGRQPSAGARRTPAEAEAALASYTSYFGTFTANEAEGFVTHHVRGDLNPSRAGADHKNLFEFSGNRLILKPPRGASGVQLQLTWAREPDLAELTPEHRKFIGFWEFAAMERRTADGEVVPTDTTYEDGFIIYTASGHMAVHLGRPGRTKYAAAQPTPEEAQAALRTYVSYFGPFTIHEADGFVVHERIGTTIPGPITPYQRYYTLTEDRKLILQPPGSTVDGREVKTFLTWERLSE